jgi:predicted RNase H-like HicB family nuclease
MKLYRLEYTIRPPQEDEEPDKFIAEIPLLPGCRAWGDSPVEALEILQSLAAAYIESSLEHGDPLPPALRALTVNSGGEVTGELLIAV